MLTGALARLRPEDKAVVYGMSISVAMNDTAFFGGRFAISPVSASIRPRDQPRA